MCNEQWVCHITGPDDVIDCKNELAALRMANNLNKLTIETKRHEYDPVVIAVAKDISKEKA